VLVTGGAGYIGTHTVLSLLDAGASVVILDNLCNSSAASLERVKELAGDKASRIAFHQARGGVRGRRLRTRLCRVVRGCVWRAAPARAEAWRPFRGRRWTWRTRRRRRRCSRSTRAWAGRGYAASARCAVPHAPARGPRDPQLRRRHPLRGPQGGARPRHAPGRSLPPLLPSLRCAPGLTRAAPRCASTPQVGESVSLPLKYYNNNLVATLNLLESMGRHGCKRVRPRPSRDSALTPKHAHAAPHHAKAALPARPNRTHGR